MILTMIMKMNILALMIKIVTVCIDEDVGHEHYCYDTVQGAQTWSQEIGFPKCLQTYFPGTMSTGLSRSSPNCRRIDTAMLALRFLPLGWDQPNPPFKPLHSAGFCCCRRRRWIQIIFFCADPPPWSRGLDSPPLPSQSIARCSSFDCGRQAQGDWGLGWRRFLQIWGDQLKVMLP